MVIDSTPLGSSAALCDVVVMFSLLLGRVGSTARTLSIGLQPIGMITSGVLLDSVGGGVTLLLMGGGLLAVTACFALSRALRGATIIGGVVGR